MDGLDCPLVNVFEASFFELYPEEEQPISRPAGDSMARYGANMLPLEHHSRGKTSPLMIYPYERSRDTLERLYANGGIHPCHGTKLQYVNPETGGSVFPTMAVFLQLLPAGFTTQRYRSTDATIYCVKEGRGKTTVGDSCLDWKEHDVFVVPSWYPVRHEIETAAILFSFSDRAAQTALGLWREEELAD
jgi:gentisate 1,2-dioxygenase